MGQGKNRHRVIIQSAYADCTDRFTSASGASTQPSLPCSSMKLNGKLFVTTALLSAMLAGCKSKMQTRNRLDESQFPPIVLWAWERPEDLRGLDSKRFAVAFLAQTLRLRGDDVILSPRQQPLQVQRDTKVMAVTRIESSKITGERAALSDAQKRKLVSLVK